MDCCQGIGLLEGGLLSRYSTVRGWTAVKVLDCYRVDCCLGIGLLEGGLLSMYLTVRGWTAVKVLDC